MGRGENPEGGALGLSSARRRTPQHAEGGARTEEMRRLHLTLLTSREILSLADRLHYDRMPHELAREDYRELKDQFLMLHHHGQSLERALLMQERDAGARLGDRIPAARRFQTPNTVWLEGESLEERARFAAEAIGERLGKVREDNAYIAHRTNSLKMAAAVARVLSRMQERVKRIDELLAAKQPAAA